MQRTSVKFTNDCGGNQFKCNSELETKSYALQKPFKTDFFKTSIGNVKLRPSFLCEIICKNYFIIKFIKMYSLIFIIIV